jgi:hypothetical protein
LPAATRAPGLSSAFQVPTWIAAVPDGLGARAGTGACASAAAEATVAAIITIIIRRMDVPWWLRAHESIGDATW